MSRACAGAARRQRQAQREAESDGPPNTVPHNRSSLRTGPHDRMLHHAALASRQKRMPVRGVAGRGAPGCGSFDHRGWRAASITAGGARRNVGFAAVPGWVAGPWRSPGGANDLVPGEAAAFASCGSPMCQSYPPSISAVERGDNIRPMPAMGQLTRPHGWSLLSRRCQLRTRESRPRAGGAGVASGHDHASGSPGRRPAVLDVAEKGSGQAGTEGE